MPAKDSQNIQTIRKLVGTVTKEQLRYVDCFVADDMALFMPVGGACLYAITPEHTHPSYMFVLHFDDRTSTSMSGRRESRGRRFTHCVTDLVIDSA